MGNADVTIREATAEDLLGFYGHMPEGEIRAWLALYKGIPACMAGYRRDPGGYVAFSDVKPWVRAPRMTVYRTAKAMFDAMLATGVPLITAAKGCGKQAPKFLASLGFVFAYDLPDGHSVLMWRGR